MLRRPTTYSVVELIINTCLCFVLGQLEDVHIFGKLQTDVFKLGVLREFRRHLVAQAILRLFSKYAIVAKPAKLRYEGREEPGQRNFGGDEHRHLYKVGHLYKR